MGAPWGVTKWIKLNHANKVTRAKREIDIIITRSLSPKKRPLGSEARCRQTLHCLWSVSGLSISPERSRSESRWSLYHSRWECLWYQSLKFTWSLICVSKLGAWLTNADLSERVVREGVLAVAVRDGDGHTPVTHPRGELGPGAGVFLRANELPWLRCIQFIFHTIDWVTDSWETQKWMMMMKSELTMYMMMAWDPLQPSTCLSRARHVMMMWWTVSH